MYKVLYHPEVNLFFQDAAKGAFACLAFQGQKSTRPLLFSLATKPDEKLQDEIKFELAAALLNRPRPLKVISMRLRLLNEVVRQQVEEMSLERPQFSFDAYSPSYGRID